jgi:hypothetical protein
MCAVLGCGSSTAIEPFALDHRDTERPVAMLNYWQQAALRPDESDLLLAVWADGTVMISDRADPAVAVGTHRRGHVDERQLADLLDRMRALFTYPAEWGGTVQDSPFVAAAMHTREGYFYNTRPWPPGQHCPTRRLLEVVSELALRNAEIVTKPARSERWWTERRRAR